MRHFRSRAALLVILSILVVGGFVVTRAWPSFSPRSITIRPVAAPLSLDPATGLPLVQVMVNGRGPYAFIVDTGAQATVVTTELARELGLGPGIAVNAGRPGGGTTPGRLAHLDHIDIGGTRLNDLDVAVLDLSVLWSGAESPRGVLSIVTLRDVLVTLDVANQMLAVTDGGLPVPDGVATFAWVDGSAVPTATIDLGGHQILATLDTGSSFDLTLPDRYAADLPLVSAPIASAGDRGVDGTLATRSAVLVGAGHIGEHAIESPVLTFADVPRAKVGIGLLKDVTLVIDATNRRVRITRKR